MYTVSIFRTTVYPEKSLILNGCKWVKEDYLDIQKSVSYTLPHKRKFLKNYARGSL